MPYNRSMRIVRFLPALLLVLACAPAVDDVERPNLLLVTMDTLRRDAVGCYGKPGPLTPHMDQLAASGVLFTRAQVSVPLTAPSHATMMTGLHPASHGLRVNGRRLPEEATTLAELLRAKRYETAAFLASQVLSRANGLHQGFDLYDDVWEKTETDLHEREQPERKGNFVVDSFSRWFAKRNRSRPFFAWVHFYDPHRPLNPPAPYQEVAGGDAYSGEVAFADRQLGRVLHAIEEEGSLARTIVVVVGDHGEGLGDHGETEHGFLLYETTVSAPWILSFPGGPSGQLIEEGVETVDLLPTLADLLALEPDPSRQGRNLLPLLGEPGEHPERPQYAESFFGNVSYRWAPLYAVREGDWKLVRGSKDELYDLASDPGESRDVSRENPDAVARLAVLLQETRGRHRELEMGEAEGALSAEQRAMLEALGYVAPSFPITEDENLPHPPERYPAHEMLLKGEALEKEGKLAEAKALFEQAIAVDPENILVLESLASWHRRDRNFDEEEKYLRRLLSVDAKHAPTWNNLGNVILRRAGAATDGALTCFLQALTSDSTYAPAYVNLGNTRLSAGDPDGAIRFYDKALAHRPDLPHAHYGKALALKSKGEEEKHIRSLQAALDSDPNFEPARRMLPSYKPRSAKTKTRS
ncbi:MAG: sulfatase-like hydrolase/transferase [Candidatus Eisenbacteria bacterium]|nr:sulfatase-like hydrolase/transferase [Candidatus Eisenbacteria bacterium]